MAAKKYYRRPDGLYEVSRTVDGKRMRFTGRTCAEVDKKIEALQVEKLNGRKVKVIAEEWIREREADIKAGTLTTNTLRSYENSIKMRISKAELYNKKAGEVTPMDCMRYIRGVERQGYSGSTVTVDIAVLRGIFSYAVLMGDCTVSPMTEVRKSRGLPKKTREALTEEQEQKVINCRTGKYWLLGYMLLYTGMRRGELLALDWQDFDRENGVIHITKKIVYAGSNRPTLEHRLKNAEKRDAPLLDVLADVLPRGRVGKIWHNDKGEYLAQQQWDKLWRQYCTDAGLMETVVNEYGKEKTVPAVTAHQFRHTMATICFEAGLDTKAFASVIGDTEAVANAVYAHLREGHRGEQMAKLNNFTRRMAING